MRQRSARHTHGGLNHISDLIAERIAIVDARVRTTVAASGSAQPLDPPDTRMQIQTPRLMPIITR